jgi:hypothetical protein
MFSTTITPTVSLEEYLQNKTLLNGTHAMDTNGSIYALEEAPHGAGTMLAGDAISRDLGVQIKIQEQFIRLIQTALGHFNETTSADPIVEISTTASENLSSIYPNPTTTPSEGTMDFLSANWHVGIAIGTGVVVAAVGCYGFFKRVCRSANAFTLNQTKQGNQDPQESVRFIKNDLI